MVQHRRKHVRRINRRSHSSMSSSANAPRSVATASSSQRSGGRSFTRGPLFINAD
jgi:hypothetical protein